jgi:hypothetical protein
MSPAADAEPPSINNTRIVATRHHKNQEMSPDRVTH